MTVQGKYTLRVFKRKRDTYVFCQCLVGNVDADLSAKTEEPCYQIIGFQNAILV